ncbi:MAG: hypothetical protein U0996_00820 [Planctomycetaceae bacterium]
MKTIFTAASTSLIVLLSLTAVCAQEPRDAQEGNFVRVRSGGTGRFFYGRWGTVSGTLENRTDEPARSLLVVTPASGGLQYGRRIEIPPKVMFESSWPVYLPGPSQSGPMDFQYLHFPGGEEDGVIRRERNETLLPSFTVIASSNEAGVTGYLPETSIQRDDGPLMECVQALKFAKTGSLLLASFLARDISHHPESLEPLDSLVVADSRLVDHPQAAESIRVWTQRGGRLMIPLNFVGEDVARMLLGDALPFTVVGQSSSNTVRLDINPDYSEKQYPQRFVDRTFDEPVSYLRVMPGAGETIWSVDGWPVAIRVPVGNGTALLTSITPTVFFEPRTTWKDGEPSAGPIASSRRMLETLFERRSPPLVQNDVAGGNAAALVGYDIPSRSVAVILLAVFPVLMISVGTWLYKRGAGERILWVVPALALASALPAVAIGMSVRSVAPETFVESRVIYATPGATEVAEDGVASVYLPESRDLPVSSETGAVLWAVLDSSSSDYRRLVWDGAVTTNWQKLNQPAGLKSYAFRSSRKLESPIKVTGTFDEQGFVGTLQSATSGTVSDLLIAGMTPDRIGVQRGADGSLRASDKDVLEPGQYSSAAITSEDQAHRRLVLDSLFLSGNRVEQFPVETAFLFWEQSDVTSLKFNSPGARVQEETLVVQPIRWIPPKLDAPISIPSPFLTFRAIDNTRGGLSGIFSNTKREWVALESGSDSVFELQIPSCCRPFEASSADVKLNVRAGSRLVTVFGGQPGEMKKVAEFESPLGVVTATIPAELLTSARSGRIYLQLSVSSLSEGDSSEPMEGEQDDNYKVEQCLITLHGKRIASTHVGSAP